MMLQELFKVIVVNRDLKPDNLMFRGDDLHMIDFGFATQFDPKAPFTKSGSPDFMSRRALAGKRPSYSDDLESLGWLLIWIENGRKFPWKVVDGNFDVQCVQVLKEKDQLLQDGYLDNFGKPIAQLFAEVDRLQPGEGPDFEALLAVFCTNFTAEQLSGPYRW